MLPTPPLFPGLSAWTSRYDVLFVDVWGVVHDGIAAFPAAVEALAAFRARGGTVLLVSNAPQPSPQVTGYLSRLGVSPDAYDRLITAGDIARDTLVERAATHVVHIGPDHYRSVLDGLDIAWHMPDRADLVVCTGFVDDRGERVDDYREPLRDLAARGLDMICANPDLVVEVGGTLYPCAGQIATLYETLGGRVIRTGKPDRRIYETALAEAGRLRGVTPRPGRILAIGDGLVTDMPGAHAFGIDAVFVTTGIHRADLMDGDAVRQDAAGRALAAFMPSVVGITPALSW